jgi:peptidoglycan/xylan/chitin deacetylase (PgdA/CDA1 family)
MITLINKFIDDKKICLNDIFNNKILNNKLLDLINDFYKINLTEPITNLDILKKQIYDAVSPRSIMFHNFHNKISPKFGQGSISEEQLINIIEKIGRENILDIDEWLEKYNNCELKKNQVCLTIDDGLKCQFKVALPVLKKYNIKAGWYIYTNPINKKYEFLDIYKYFSGIYYNNFEEFYLDFYNYMNKNNFYDAKQEFDKANYLDKVSCYSYNDRLFRYIRDNVLSKDEFKNLILEMIKTKNLNVKDLIRNIWMTKDEIKELAKTQLIGLHSCNHPTRMDLVDEKQQYNEYKDCKDCLEILINKNIYTLSYPCGRYNKDTFKICKEINIKYAFISYLTKIDLENKNFLIQRIDSICVVDDIQTITFM